MTDNEKRLQEELGEAEISDFKRKEILRDVPQWQSILSVDPYRESLNAIDRILQNNDYDMTAHLGGEGYAQVSLGDQSVPEQVLLKIDDTAENLTENIDNHFFQSITEENKEYTVKEFPALAFELNSTYDETFEVPTEYNNLEIRHPTHRSFYEQRFRELDPENNSYED